MATKQIVKPSELRNPDGLSKDHINAITHYLGRLRELDEQAAVRAVHYVVDGSDEDVLLALGGMKEAAPALLLSGVSYSSTNWEKLQHAAKERAAIFRGATETPGVWIRLGQVFDVIRRAAGSATQTPPGWPTWLVTLVVEVICASYAERQESDRLTWTVRQLEAILASAELPADLLARAYLDQQAANSFQGGSYYYYGEKTSVFTDWDAYLAEQLPVVREALARQDVNHRLYVLRTLGEMHFDFSRIVDLLVQLGTSSSKTVRDAVLPLLSGCAEQARPLIEGVLTTGDASERHEAALLLWRVGGRETAAVLQQRLADEPSERVKQTIEKLLAAPAELSAEDARQLTESLPPVRIELGEVELPEAAKTGLREFFDKAWQQAMLDYQKQMEQWSSPDRPKWMNKPEEPLAVTAKELKELYDFVEGKSNTFKQDHRIRGYTWRGGPLGDWLAPPDIKLIHVVRLDYASGFLTVDGGNMDRVWWREQRNLEAYRGRCKEPFGLRELDAAIATLPNGKPTLIARVWIASNSSYNSFCDWEPEAIWPIYAEHPEVLHEILVPKKGPSTAHDYSMPMKRQNVFRVLAMFPQLPTGFIPPLWDIALGEAKSDREPAQAALATVPNKAAKVLVALRDGRQSIRAAAAEWLGKIGDASVLSPLKEAVRNEKQEVVKGAMMTALEVLGADVQEFLDRDALLAEAEAGLKKKRPKGMEWMPLDRLPALHWEDDGRVVDPRIVQWWLVQSVQQKSPACGPVLRRYLAMCRKHETAALAKFVLTSWISRDTSTPPHEEAAALARKEADRQWSQWGQQQYFIDLYKGNKDNLYQQLLPGFANKCLYSAINEKGMLAIVAAAGDGECVKLCEQYIRKWFGNRLAQCKCLVEVLAWISHPLAIQVLLSFANRFRTKVVQKTAGEHVQALADREGWTIDELADRTIPDAGFERPTPSPSPLPQGGEGRGEGGGGDAALVLDYGPRKFTVQLDDELQPILRTEEGKTVKNPPAAGKQDDADKAKAARKAFTDAKKTIKEVVKRQSERFYEFLCTQRDWRFADWRRYLADHPIAGKVCIRLAWSAVARDEDGVEQFLGCFRPLEDGSLTNEKDEEVTLADDVRVRLAHTCNTPADIGAAWSKHFEDYDVTPLFQQFGRDTYTLPEAKKKETDINDFEGHLLTTFQLRGKGNKLGYLRGDAEDGGCFYLYRKPFASLGLQAVIEFSGSCLPETDVPAALHTLYFTSMKKDRDSVYSWQPSKLPLSKVPPVLLSECYNDIKQIAAEGSGFDPKWKEKSYF